MRLLIVTDAWLPQVNGVVTSLRALVAELEAMGHAVGLITPQDFRHVPCPSYPEIPLAWDLWTVGEKIGEFAPDCVHLATEGPLGWAARRWLVRRGMKFSSAIHTRFPEYVHTRWPWLPLGWGYAFLRRFHAPSEAVLVSSERMRGTFASHGFANLALWRKGVDIQRFQPREGVPTGEPVFLYVGRLAREKNLEAFLDLDLPGCKRVVGDGPQRAVLEATYPQVEFLGYRHGEELVEAYRSASVLVFPSLTDTLGLVMYEALACGTPVAAFPVSGPLDVLEEGVTGAMDTDLLSACLRALSLDRQVCAQWACGQTWRMSAQEFLSLQVRARALPLNEEPAYVDG
ncbi:glycosyltransferase family 1 protein [Pseudomonas sp. PDNC002]|uniref:glycosyltransferase family 4 protein n=1 Tax=Pseudomonas sp. PDNC002 TaxID=2811422 RepID=UPI0019658E02|nr:glycosyltransferase family 1 protein [Pseudomonas sp. PDNC002]QRY78901.1 glycosyltransferase family 1 protein [Pseudomonas sp. PDNC002]